jgi:hypothetical protein
LAPGSSIAPGEIAKSTSRLTSAGSLWVCISSITQQVDRFKGANRRTAIGSAMTRENQTLNMKLGGLIQINASVNGDHAL